MSAMFTRRRPGPAPALQATTGPAAAEEAQAVRLEMLGALLDQTRTALAGNVVIALTAVAVLLGSGRHPLLLVWCAAVLTLVALRARHAHGLRQRWATLDAGGTEQAERQVALLMGCSGAVWGLLPWLAYTGQDAFVDFFTIAMLVGMTAGAVNSAAALPRALNPYIVLALAPFCVRSVVLGDTVSLGGGVTILFSMGVLLAFGRTSYRSQLGAVVAKHENQRLARALQKERDAVQAASRAKDLFLAGVTHDLRQPVHALALHLRHLRSLDADELAPSLVRELTAPMDTALRAMSVQLTRLLDLSRLEAGEAQVLRRPFWLPELFDQLQAQFTPLAQERGLALEWSPLPVAVDTDPRLLQSIADNLVANALRYTSAGRVRVAVRRRRAGRVELLVMDTGPGIAAALLPLLFTPYRRFDDRDRGGDEPGQGLGLALVQKQAELLGHPLRVRSRPGRGSVFAVALPLAPTPAG